MVRYCGAFALGIALAASQRVQFLESWAAGSRGDQSEGTGSMNVVPAIVLRDVHIVFWRDKDN
jgi:hypothetical protein